MTSTVDIVPSIGHGLLFSQIGPIAGYDAIDMRRLAQVGNREGTHDDTGWAVTEHTPNAMSVDISANVGLATIQGDSVPGQGLYVVAPHITIATLDVDPAHATLPRLDQVILHAYDDTHDGLGFNKATLEMKTGTPTSGATSVNRNGAAALPNSAMPLFDILVAPAAAVIRNTDLVDRRDSAITSEQPGDLIFSAATTRIGCLPADFGAISRFTYAKLFAKIGTTHGVGDGSTTFNKPDMRGRVPRGSGAASGVTTYANGAKIGEEFHVLTIAELAQHNHAASDNGHAHTESNFPINPSGGGWGKLGSVVGTPGGSGSSVVPYSNNYNAEYGGVTGPGSASINVGMTGSNSGHNNVQPSTVANWFIKF